MVKNLEEKISSSKGYEKPKEVKVHTYDEAIKASLEYFKGDSFAADVFVGKYAKKDSFGNIFELTPDDMHHRLAREIARIETHYSKDNSGSKPLDEGKIYEVLKDFKYIVPQGGPMTGIGNDYQIASLSNCFVIGNPPGAGDSYGAILKIDQEQVQLMKRRGGVGHDLSQIRPKNSPVKNSALTSTGVVPFMERYSNSTREVAQDGRRGALMLSISSKHPDAEDFIDAKLEKGKITGANVSVKIDDEFMRAVENGESYIQQYPVDSKNPKFKKEIDPREIWNKIVHNAWKSAEPGILFWDNIKREAIPDVYGKDWETVSTNPCGEIPLCPYDSCRLLAINLSSYVENPYTPEAKFNKELFKEHIGYAQRMMDDIIDLELEKIDSIRKKIKSDPEDEETKRVEMNLWNNIEEKARKGRRTGVGITAEGDMLASLGLRYGSEEAIDFSEEVHKTIAVEAYRSSVQMAKERGAFEIYDTEKEKDNPFINRIKEADPELYQEMVKHGRRNIALLTVAPTGTVSIMTQTTNGLENSFMPAHLRKKKINPGDKNARVDFVDENGDKWQEYPIFEQGFKRWMKTQGFDINKKYSNEEIAELVKLSPYFGATSTDVDWVAKVKMQGRVQKWVDHSISVTVNLPEDIPEEKVGEVYLEAWKAGCKGITVYREGSRDGVITSVKNKEGGLAKLVQNNVKADPRLNIKPQAIKYKVKRMINGDSLHFIMASNLYVDDNEKKAYFIPDEDFQIRAPIGAATSVSFAQSGMDRTEILRGPSPNYAEMVRRLQSPFSNEDEGLGPRRIKSIEHAAGLVFEDYFLRNGIIGRDENTGELINKVEKSKLRKVNDMEEYKKIISQIKNEEEGEEISLNGNHGKLDSKFNCERCGGTSYRTLEGCSNPICSECGWSDPSKSCG